jgi:hypothetical protein
MPKEEEDEEEQEDEQEEHEGDAAAGGLDHDEQQEDEQGEPPLVQDNNGTEDGNGSLRYNILPFVLSCPRLVEVEWSATLAYAKMSPQTRRAHGAHCTHHTSLRTIVMSGVHVPNGSRGNSLQQLLQCAPNIETIEVIESTSTRIAPFILSSIAVLAPALKSLTLKCAAIESTEELALLESIVVNCNKLRFLRVDQLKVWFQTELRLLASSSMQRSLTTGLIHQNCSRCSKILDRPRSHELIIRTRTDEEARGTSSFQ